MHILARIRVEDAARRAGLSAVRGVARALFAMDRNHEKRIDDWIQLPLYFPGTGLGRVGLRNAASNARRMIASQRFHDNVRINRSAVIKPYIGEREPGIVVVSFESELGKLALAGSLEEFEKHYRVMFLPSWQPVYSKELSVFDSRVTKPYFILPSSLMDGPLVESYSLKAEFLPFHAASWVNAELYREPKADRDIDLIMLANFSRRKRHWRLFELMKDLPQSVRCVVAGVSMGQRTKESVLSEAKLFGVGERVSIIEGASDAELRELLRRSRLFCAMSTKEGSYIGVVEGLMAGVPVAMVRGARVGSRAYINSETGFFIDDNRNGAKQLATALERSGDLAPQDWAKREISAQVNCKKLGDTLRSWSIRNALQWSEDILPFYCERFQFKCFNENDSKRRQAAEDDIAERFGVRLS